MTTATPTAAVQRTFIYNDVTLPDPGAQYSNEDVRRHLAAEYFPELAQCEVKAGDVKDGAQEIRFVKKVTTKGRDPDDDGIEVQLAVHFDNPHLNALQTLPGGIPTTPRLPDLVGHFGTDEPSVADVLNEDNDLILSDFLDIAWDITHDNRIVTEGGRTRAWLSSLPSQPLPRIPVGF